MGDAQLAGVSNCDSLCVTACDRTEIQMAALKIQIWCECSSLFCTGQHHVPLSC
jgi:hypothetical protein